MICCICEKRTEEYHFEYRCKGNVCKVYEGHKECLRLLDVYLKNGMEVKYEPIKKELLTHTTKTL